MPGLLLRVDAENLLLFGHFHVGLVALSEVVKLHTHTHTSLSDVKLSHINSHSRGERNLFFLRNITDLTESGHRCPEGSCC